MDAGQRAVDDGQRAGMAATPRPRSLPSWMARAMSAAGSHPGSGSLSAPVITPEPKCWFADTNRQLVLPRGAAGRSGGPASAPEETRANTPGTCWFRSPPTSTWWGARGDESDSSRGAAEPRGSIGGEESEEREEEDVNSDEEDSDDEESEGDDELLDDGTAAVGSSSSKLWGPAQYPEGTKSAHACWDWANIQAAQAWSCPCPDRENCIGARRLRPEELLIHRKEYLTTLRSNKRDAARLLLAEHYNADTRACSRSFVVGRLNDCCAASRGLADGNSWSTWSRARADLRMEKPLHAGRR
jgi:hypothetical protein